LLGEHDIESSQNVADKVIGLSRPVGSATQHTKQCEGREFRYFPPRPMISNR
jgi:hypothetical protein